MIEPVRTYTNDEIIKELVKNAFDNSFEGQYYPFKAGYLESILQELMNNDSNVLSYMVDRLDWQKQIMEREGKN